jgi:hypothetical protein
MKQYFAKLIGEDNGVAIVNHKLFLCSRDLQIGDRFIHPKYPKALLHGVDPDIVESENDLIYLKEHDYFKVVGEILTPGIKEGQEFTEKTLNYLNIK